MGTVRAHTCTRWQACSPVVTRLVTRANRAGIAKRDGCGEGCLRLCRVGVLVGGHGSGGRVAEARWWEPAWLGRRSIRPAWFKTKLN